MSWTRKPLAQLADLCLGKMLDEKKNKGDPMPYLANVNVRWGAFDLDILREMRFEPHEMERYGLKYGDIVMCEGGEPGRCAIWKDETPGMMIQKALHRIRPNAELDYRFLYYVFLLKGRNDGFSGLFTGSTIKHLPGQNLAKVEVSYPPRPEQERIADTLFAYDDLIENNRRRIKLLEDAARLLYREWFVHLRFPGHEHVKIVDGVPEGWERKAISDFAEIYRGISYSSDELVEEGGKPFVNLKCMDRLGGFRISGLKSFLGKHKPHQAVTAGDLVVAVTDMTRDALVVSQAARVPRVVGDDAVFSMDMVKIVPRSEFNSSWLYGLLRFSQFPFEVREMATGATVLHLRPKYIEEWQTSIPPVSLRNEYAEYVEPIYSLMDALEVESEKLRQARNLLLPRLMRGDLAV